MKNIYIQNKLVFILGICTALFGLNNLSALAQQRKPTPAEIEQAKTSLRQQVQSLKNSNYFYYVQEKRNQEQIQARNKLVDSWKQIEPELAPFIGGWSGYESSWNIYPSNTKNKVCIIQRDEEGNSTIDIGTAIDSNIYTQKGKVFFKDDNYLGVSKIDGNRFVQVNDMPLSSPRVLQEPLLLKNISGFSPFYDVLKSYVDAGCTASSPGKNDYDRTAIGDLSDGNYTYGQLPFPGIIGTNYIAFRKSGNVLIGISYDGHSGASNCLHGTVKGDSIINATSITTPIGEPGAKDIIDKDKLLSLSEYYFVKDIDDTKSINRCKQKIMSNVPQKQFSTVSSNYKKISPDLEIPNYVQFGSLEFIKGEKGFYILRHTNNKRCVGIDRKVNKLATAHCGYDNFNMWNLIPISSENDDKFLYIINLRGSGYCLSKESSLTSCNNLGLLMAPSLN